MWICLFAEFLTIPLRHRPGHCKCHFFPGNCVFAARKSPKLIVVFLGKSEWAEKVHLKESLNNLLISNFQAHPDDIPDRNRTCQLLDRILDAHNVPMLYNIQDALDYIEEEVIGSKKWTDAIANPNQRLSYLSLRAKRLARGAQMKAKQAWNKVENGENPSACIDDKNSDPMHGNGRIYSRNSRRIGPPVLSPSASVPSTPCHSSASSARQRSSCRSGNQMGPTSISATSTGCRQLRCSDGRAETGCSHSQSQNVHGHFPTCP